MSDVIATGRYTRALFEMAEQEKVLAWMDTALASLAKVLKQEPKVLKLMANPTLTTSEKYALAVQALPGGGTGLLERFLRVLIDKKRFSLLPEIQKVFHAAFEKKTGHQEVEMISAVTFSASFTEKLKAVLLKKLRSDPPSDPEGRVRPPAKIHLIPSVDRALLGGFILRFSGKEIDCSFKNRLHEIQQKLTASNEPSF